MSVMSETLVELRTWLASGPGRYADMSRGVSGECVVVTGTCPGMHRSELYALLRTVGMVVEDYVHATTNVLLAFDPARRTIKRKAAEGFSTPVLDEKRFVSYLLAAALLEGMGDAAIPKNVADIQPLESLT